MIHGPHSAKPREFLGWLSNYWLFNMGRVICVLGCKLEGWTGTVEEIKARKEKVSKALKLSSVGFEVSRNREEYRHL
jgi:hypothetical protein